MGRGGTDELETFDELLHGLFLFEYGLDQFELLAAAVEVVVFAVDAEVLVALEVVGEKADADGERDDFAGEHEHAAFGGGEEVAGGFDVTAGEGLEHGHFEFDAIEELFVFGGAAGGGTDHVAEVVEDETGHDGVEIDHAHGFAGLLVEHHVVELGIVMGDAGRDFAAGFGVDEGGDDLVLGLGEGDFAFGDLGAVELVAFDGAKEAFEAFGGVVKVGDGGGEFVGGQVGEEVLELAEGVTGLGGLFRGFDGVETADAIDEDEGPPEAALVVDVERLAVLGADDFEGAAVELGGAFGGEFAAEMFGDADHVVHERDGLTEDVGIDGLVDDAEEGAVVVIGGGEGFVDVPDFDAVPVMKLAGDTELSADVGEFLAFFEVHVGDVAAGEGGA